MRSSPTYKSCHQLVNKSCCYYYNSTSNKRQILVCSSIVLKTNLEKSIIAILAVALKLNCKEFRKHFLKGAFFCTMAVALLRQFLDFIKHGYLIKPGSTILRSRALYLSLWTLMSRSQIVVSNCDLSNSLKNIALAKYVVLRCKRENRS